MQKIRFLSFLVAVASMSLGITSLFAQEAKPEGETTAQPVASTQEEKKVEVVGYNKGFFIQSADEKFRMVVGGYIQGLFEGRVVENGNDTDTIRVRRARLKWSGHMFTKKAQYALEYDFSSSKLLDGFLQLTHSDPLKFRVGQYYVPFNLEGVTSSSNLQFVDRSILQAAFGIADEREPGTGFNGSLMDKKVEYDVGLFNGEGLNTTNSNNEFRYAGRVVYNVAGHHGTEFSDTKQSEEPNMAIAVGGMFNDTQDIPSGATAPIGEKKVGSFTGDVAAKYRGLGFHTGFLYQHINPDTGASVDDKGWLAQIGYFVIPKHLEVAGRVAQLYAESTKDKGEYTFGLNYFIHSGHQMKFQFDYSALTEDNGVSATDNRLDHRVRAQLQFKI